MTLAGAAVGLSLVTGLPAPSTAQANTTSMVAAEDGWEILTTVLVRANEGRGDNFQLNVAEGEEIRFIVDDEEVRKDNPSFWMNRDKQGTFGAKDKRIYSDLHHGDVRTVKDFSKDSGVRMYIKSKYKKHFSVTVERKIRK